MPKERSTKVKAKFWVNNVGVQALDENDRPKQGTVVCQPVCRGAVNKRWAQATPGGRLELTINTDAINWFMSRVGKEISLTMEDASSDPATHAFEPLEQEIQDRTYVDPTCAECGQSEEAHQ